VVLGKERLKNEGRRAWKRPWGKKIIGRGKPGAGKVVSRGLGRSPLKNLEEEKEKRKKVLSGRGATIKGV